MQRKNQSVSDKKPYSLHEEISVFYEMKFGNQTINPQDFIKIANEKGNFKFIQLVHNSAKDVTWIDCYQPQTGMYRSFYVDRLRGIFRSKRNTRKKLDVN